MKERVRVVAQVTKVRLFTARRPLDIQVLAVSMVCLITVKLGQILG